MSCFDDLIRAKFTNVERTPDQLHHYQSKLAIPFLLENPFSGLFIDMGLGKTISSLTVIAELIAEFRYEKVLVIGPLKVATETWPTEIGLWRHTAWMNYSLIHVMEDDPRLKEARRRGFRQARLEGLDPGEARRRGDEAVAAERERIRIEAATSPKSIHIISRDWVKWLVDFYKRKWPYKMVIIDESSGFKDHKSNRFKALKKVRNTNLIERLHILTATPAAETYEHLFAQIYLLDKGERLGKSITKFRERYFIENKWSRKLKLRPDADREILDKIKDICLVLKAEDYLQVSKPVIVRRKIALTQDERALYRKLEKDFVVTLPDGTEIEAETAATLSSKLLQMASGVIYETQQVEDPKTGGLRKQTKVHRIHDHKIETLKQIVEEAQGEPILVGYHFKSSLDRLKKAFPKAVAMDKDGKAVKSWNARKIPMLLMHPQSGGHGLNLQKGGHIIVFFDIPWSLELFLQFIGRLARQGQEKVVKVFLLVAAGTLDEAVADALEAKEDAQERMFKILKRLIGQYRKSLG